jgi:hypothetical protein
MFAETAIVEYNLSFANQGNKLSFSVCRKYTEVCHFPFPFVEKKRKSPYSVISFFHLRNSRNMETGVVETWNHGDIDMERWKHEEMDAWRHGEIETWRHGDMGTSNGNLKSRQFPLIRLPSAHCANGSFSFVRL